MPYVSHEEFRSALPAGRLRVVIDPARAWPYVSQRTRTDLLGVLVIGAGVVVALTGLPWVGGALVAAGIVARRLVKRHAPNIALHLALRVPAVYAEVTSNGVMEVRRAG
ncbi:MAG: hypothetical protein KIT17_26340 [Rubrivivax sp.]|nr:hypothetical protein [Rubrivivax sp.]